MKRFYETVSVVGPVEPSADVTIERAWRILDAVIAVVMIALGLSLVAFP